MNVTNMHIDGDKVARRYDRIAPVYDVLVAPMEWFGGSRRRRRLLGHTTGRTLEVGIGTGRNIGKYPRGVELTGIDISRRMLVGARQRAEQIGKEVPLEHANVEHLPFPDSAFDTVTATCVFCSVENPVRGLEEVRRVLKPMGRALLLEHVRPRGRVLGWIFDRLSPLTRKLFGCSINRRTEESIVRAGFDLAEVKREGVWREIVAVPREPQG